MNILIIKLSPVETITSSMFRTLAVARGLQEMGNSIDILVVPNNGMNAVSSQREFINNLNIVRTGRNEAYNKYAKTDGRKTIKNTIVGALKKVWHKVSIYDYTYSIVKHINISILPRDEYDIVISSSDPKTSHLAVRMLIDHGLKYGRWIQYWGDPLTLDITNENIWPKFILRNIEKHLIEKADKVVYVSPFTLEKQKKLFKKESGKMIFLPVAYMEEEVYQATNNERFFIGYYGNYEIRVRNILPFYEACISMGETVDVSIFGDTDLKLDSTDYVKIFPRGIVDEHKRKADLLVCILNSSGTQIPGKLYHLAGTNKKVLVIVDGEYASELTKYLEQFKRFYICENNEKSIKEKITEIINDNRSFEPLKQLRYDYIAANLIE